MSYGSDILMSGNFHFDFSNGSGGRGTGFRGVHPGIFRTPASPSVSSSVCLADSTSSLSYGPSTPCSNFKRKRFGGNEWTRAADEPTTGDARFNDDTVIMETEKRYVLAGLGETPQHEVPKQLGSLEDSIHSDVDYRRALGSKQPWDDDGGGGAFRTSADNPKPKNAGWSSFAINTIGGVVGKVWEFCKIGAFRGFYAGGGAGYDISGSTARPPLDNRGWGADQDVSMSSEQDTSPFYGDLPPSDYSPYHYERETPESTPPPAAKRRQISYGTPTDELGKNWVMVSDPVDMSRQPSQASRASSRRPVQRTTAPPLVRRISKPVSRLNAPTFNRHPTSRPSIAGSGSVSNREPASFASARSPMASPVVKAYTPSRIPVPSRAQSPSTFTLSQGVQQPSRIPSPSPYAKRGHRRSQSAISSSSISPVKIAKRDSLLGIQDNSPRLDAKARSLAAKRMKEEMETDSRINDFNARLKDMIRQGREALGTTYEIELDDDDGPGGDPWESE